MNSLLSLLGGGGAGGYGTNLNSPGSASGKGTTASYAASGGNNYATGATASQIALIVGVAAAALVFIGLAIFVIARK